MRLFIMLLLVYPLAEIVALVMLADWLGGLTTLLLVTATSLFGLWMLRNQKVGAVLGLAGMMRQGQQVSVYSLLYPLRYALAGLLFLIPGVINSSFGLLLLLPFKGPHIHVNRTGTTPGNEHQAENVIDGEYSRVESSDKIPQDKLP